MPRTSLWARPIIPPVDRVHVRVHGLRWLLSGFANNLHLADIASMAAQLLWLLSVCAIFALPLVASEPPLMLKPSASICAVLALAALAPSHGAAATFIVDKNFWGDSAKTGSFAWAIHQSNIMPGLDEIQLFSDVSADDLSPPLLLETSAT